MAKSVGSHTFISLIYSAASSKVSLLDTLCSFFMEKPFKFKLYKEKKFNRRGIKVRRRVKAKGLLKLHTTE